MLTCLLLGSTGLCVVGCGSSVLSSGAPLYPNALRDDRGEEIHLVTLESIINDDDLTESEKRQALEALGIEDEDIQEYLLTNF